MKQTQLTLRRVSALTDVVSYKSGTAKHNLVLSPELLDRIAGNTNSFDEADLTKWDILHNVYRLSRHSKDLYLQLQPSIRATFSTESLKGKGLESITSATLNVLSRTLPDLVTFNSSMVDQLDWERVAGIELTDGTDEAECDFFAIINEFLCNAIVSPIAGQQFHESYQLLASDLVVLNQYYYALALGLPRFFPLPGLPGASLARKRLLQNFDKLFDELENPPVKRVVQDDESMSGEETDADAPTPITALHDLFTTNNVPIPARASIALEAVHRIIAQAVPLAFWTILHIYRASSQPDDFVNGETPLIRIREESKKWAEAIQPPSIHPAFPSPPEISFAGTGPLFNPSGFTYVRSCIFEAKRMYRSSVTTAILKNPITFTESIGRGDKDEWQLDAGSYLDIGLSQRLINTSPTNYISPDQYRPDRFKNSQPPSPLASTTFNDSEELVTSLLVAFVTGVAQLWNITAAPKKTLREQFEEAQAAAVGEKAPVKKNDGKEKKVGVWSVPKTVEGASMLLPKADIRVRIRRREGLDGPRTMRKGR